MTSTSSSIDKRLKNEIDDDDDDHDISFQLMLSQFLLQTTISKETLSFGGNKNKELPRCRKDIEKDIFRLLGDYNFRRTYRMKKLTFYKLHSLLHPLLLRQFFPKRGGTDILEKIATLLIQRSD